MAGPEGDAELPDAGTRIAGIDRDLRRDAVLRSGVQTGCRRMRRGNGGQLKRDGGRKTAQKAKICFCAT